MYLKSITTDLLSGVVVGVILIPTAMAYGIIAGVGPASGLYGAIAIGLIAAVTGGTRAFISGPNVFVAVVMGPVVADYGLEGAFTAALLTGIIPDRVRRIAPRSVHHVYPPLSSFGNSLLRLAFSL